MTEETVSSQLEEQVAETPEVQEEVVEQPQEEVVETTEREVEKVPLTALQKERKKRQELEMRLEWEREQNKKQSQPEEEDLSKYESATKEDLGRIQQDTVRQVEEKIWIKNNPDKYERLNEYLPEFLKQRPNLAYAINSASNRYEEAWTLMEALTPRQQQQLKVAAAAPKKAAPGSPSSVPKAAVMNQAVDVMSMNDSEFAEWRKAQRRRR